MEQKHTTEINNALDTLQGLIRDAILSESADMIFKPYSGPSVCYFATVDVAVGHIQFSMSLADDFVCYHNSLMEGLFSNADLAKLKRLAERRLALTSEELKRINVLNGEIDAIKKGRR